MGAGSWGTVFAKILADAGTPVTLWARRSEVAEAINASHRNPDYFPDIELPGLVSATADPAEALRGADLVVLSVPSQTLRGNLAAWAEHLEPVATLLSLMKGIELGTTERMTEVIAEVTGAHQSRIAVLSGPNLAREIAEEQPTASVVACIDHGRAVDVQKAVTTSYFRPYTNTDVVGVELCGAVKNIIALAAGMAQGQGFGWNTLSALITRGLVEITRLGLALGAEPATFSGLAGMGDLTATCASPLSRNHRLGKHIGEGLTLAEAIKVTGGTAEGVKSSESVLELARAHDVEMPITAGVVEVLAGKLPLADLAATLLARPKKSEVAG